MASRIEEIEAIINGLVRSTAGEPLSGTTPLKYREVLDVEVPPTQYPCSTLLFSYPAQTFADLGADLSDNEWRWIQRSWFDNTDPATAQREMKKLLPALITAFRRVDPVELTLEDGTFVQLDIEDAGDPNVAEFLDGTSALTKALLLIARTEES
jgi:hypothetical protein